MGGARKHQRRPPTGTQGQPYTVREAARLLGVEQDEVRRLINRRELPAHRVGKRIAVPGDALLALIQDPEGVAA